MKNKMLSLIIIGAVLTNGSMTVNADSVSNSSNSSLVEASNLISSKDTVNIIKGGEGVIKGSNGEDIYYSYVDNGDLKNEDDNKERASMIVANETISTSSSVGKDYLVTTSNTHRYVYSEISNYNSTYRMVVNVTIAVQGGTKFYVPTNQTIILKSAILSANKTYKITVDPSSTELLRGHMFIRLHDTPLLG